MVSAILISLSIGFSVGAISGMLAYECPKCDCCKEDKKQLLKG
jgi:hypothetical protein